jgi:hypothetical protein
MSDIMRNGCQSEKLVKWGVKLNDVCKQCDKRYNTGVDESLLERFDERYNAGLMNLYWKGPRKGSIEVL